jgi:DNA mismatch repair protein MutS2
MLRARSESEAGRIELHEYTRSDPKRRTVNALPDLIHPEPRLWVDEAELRQVLTFAFASGIGSDAIERALEKTKAPPSDFLPDCFAKDLFLDEFVARCLPLRSGQRLKKPRRRSLVDLLARPPRGIETVRFRHGVLAELQENGAFRTGLERLSTVLGELFDSLEGASRNKESANLYRRIELLRAVRAAFEAIAAAAPGATSGLSRLGAFGAEVQASDGYRHLVDLLDHEGHLATVDVRLRLAQDGRIRGFEILRAAENTRNRHHAGPIARFFTRLRLLVWGYRVHERELIGRLLTTVFEELEPYLVVLFQVRRDVDFYLGALGFRDLARDKGLVVCLPSLSLSTPGAPVAKTQFESLYNPHLLLEERPPRPSDLEIGGSASLIVTGPNSGGKTRLLQAVGLAQVLAQAGYYVPAARAELALREGLFVSVVEEATADAREGRLGTELLRIRRLFERVTWGSLVIVDELCSGTNPSEAEEIFDLVMSQLAEIEPQTLVTTHFLHFAARLEKEHTLPRLEFLQVELDETQAPTFGFVRGVATTSLARRTAERLGVTREALRGLVDDAKRQRGLRVSEAPKR